MEDDTDDKSCGDQIDDEYDEDDGSDDDDKR